MHQTSDPLMPLWLQTAAPLALPEAGPRLEELGACDCVVIGAGVTGLSTALHLAEGGARVVLLEREAPGLGSTGRANGQIIAGLQRTPEAIIKAHGAELGERIVDFSGRAPDLVFELIDRHQIDCGAERSGWIQATRSEHQMPDLHVLGASWMARGAPVRLLDRTEIARLLGTDAYAGGWLDARNGMLQPLAYARGLAGAALRAGVDLHCGVSVSKLERVAERWQVRTDRGVLSARTVVVATNAFTGELDGMATALLGRSFLTAYSVQLASEPLTAAQLATVLPQRHSCGDTEHLRLRYFRLDPDNRFIIGGPGWLRPPKSRMAMSFRILAASARRMFPQLADTRFEYRWHARDSVTADLLPHLYEPAPGIFSALGYNGRGLAIGTALGSVLSRRVLGADPASLPFPITNATRAPLNLPASARSWFGSLYSPHR